MSTTYCVGTFLKNCVSTCPTHVVHSCPCRCILGGQMIEKASNVAQSAKESLKDVPLSRLRMQLTRRYEASSCGSCLVTLITQVSCSQVLVQILSIENIFFHFSLLRKSFIKVLTLTNEMVDALFVNIYASISSIDLIVFANVYKC